MGLVHLVRTARKEATLFTGKASFHQQFRPFFWSDRLPEGKIISIRWLSCPYQRNREISGNQTVGNLWEHLQNHIPIRSMYGIFTYIWLMFMVNVAKYAIHGWYGIWTTKTKNNIIILVALIRDPTRDLWNNPYTRWWIQPNCKNISPVNLDQFRQVGLNVKKVSKNHHLAIELGRPSYPIYLINNLRPFFHCSDRLKIAIPHSPKSSIGKVPPFSR